MSEMEELSAAFQGSFQVCSKQFNNPNAPHPRLSQYKQTGRASQSERRQQHLLNQKEKRKNYSNLVRRLTVGFEEGETLSEDEVDEESEQQDMELDVENKRRKKFYANQVMLSEWMVDIPEDLSEEWLAVCCPQGRRCIVVTDGGASAAYSKSGHLMQRFHSLLPGGSHRTNCTKSIKSTILDCIFCQVTKTYYILDVMCWNGHTVYDAEKEFRTFWSTNIIAELDAKVGEINKHNPFRFEILKYYPCDVDHLSKMLAELSFELDGILFYHKKAHYIRGPSPLSLWLKVYMLPDVVQMEVPQELLDTAPDNYLGFEHHLDIVRDDRQWTDSKQRWIERRQEKIRRRKEREAERLTNNEELPDAMASSPISSPCSSPSQLSPAVIEPCT